MSKVLEPKHIKYLTSNFTLKRWAGKSLDERASLFSSKFSDKSITGSSLWHLYHKHGIKFKLVAVKKIPSKDKREQIKAETKVAFDELDTARRLQLKVVYCDEIMFTKATAKKRDWSSKGNNTIVAETDYYVDYKAVIGAISKEVGNEVVYVNDKPIKQEDFINFLKILRKRNGERKLVLFMDNLSVHKCKNVRLEMEKLRIQPVYNAIYSPQFNPIEMAFSKVKAAYKKEKLNRLVHGKSLPMDSMIRTAFAKSTKENV